MDNLSKIYNQLLALRENLPQKEHVSRKYVGQYNSLLVQLAELTASSLEDFKVSESFLKYTSGISRPGIGFQGFGEKQCERGLLLMKLDAVLQQFRQGEDKPPMGFIVPENK